MLRFNYFTNIKIQIETKLIYFDNCKSLFIVIILFNIFENISVSKNWLYKYESSLVSIYYTF